MSLRSYIGMVAAVLAFPAALIGIKVVNDAAADSRQHKNALNKIERNKARGMVYTSRTDSLGHIRYHAVPPAAIASSAPTSRKQ